MQIYSEGAGFLSAGSEQRGVFRCQIELAVGQIVEGSTAIFTLKARHLKIYK